MHAVKLKKQITQGLPMIKKLVKYGNSHALVLDRSILALLDISEGSVVKLRIEGDALIVRAEKNVKPTDVLMAEVDSIDEQYNASGLPSTPIKEFFKKNTQELCDKIKNDPNSNELLKEWLPGAEKSKKYQEAMSKIFQKHQDAFVALTTQEFQQEYLELNNKYKNGMSLEEYSKEFLALRYKHAPGMALIDKEMQDVRKALGFPNELCSPFENSESIK